MLEISFIGLLSGSKFETFTYLCNEAWKLAVFAKQFITFHIKGYKNNNTKFYILLTNVTQY